MIAAAKIHPYRQLPSCGVSSNCSSSRRSGPCRPGSPLAASGTSVIVSQSLAVKGAQMSLPPSHDMQLRRPSSGQEPTHQRQSALKPRANRTETTKAVTKPAASEVKAPIPFALIASSLSGTVVTVEASCKEACSEVQEKIAFEFDVKPYRATLSTKDGVVLDTRKTLETCGILGDTELLVVIEEANRWREMSQEEFINLVAERKLDTRENMLRATSSQPAKWDEMKFRAQYIPRLEAAERALERRRRKEEYRRYVEESAAKEAGMVSEIGVEAVADRIRAKIACAQTSAEERAAAVQAVKNDAQRDLDEALPALQTAAHALNCLTKADICEVKAFKKPPPAVEVVGEAMCILFGEKPTWDNAKKLFNDVRLLENMMNYDKDNISPKVILKLDPYMQRDDFTPEFVGRASLAARGMCMWARAMHMYDRIAKVVEPKRQMLMDSQEDLDDLMYELRIWRKELEQLPTPDRTAAS